MRKTIWPDRGSIYSMLRERAHQCLLHLLFRWSSIGVGSSVSWLFHPAPAKDSKGLEVSPCRAQPGCWQLGRCCCFSSRWFGNFPSSPCVSHLPGPSRQETDQHLCLLQSICSVLPPSGNASFSYYFRPFESLVSLTVLTPSTATSDLWGFS